MTQILTSLDLRFDFRDHLGPPVDRMTSALTALTLFSHCLNLLTIVLTYALTGIFYVLIFSLTAFELLALL